METDTSISLEAVFEAYYSCLKRKRNTAEARAFEVDLEENLVTLWQELNDGSYQIAPSTVFIVDKPVKREIFAAAFRDRVVHHLIVNALGPAFEKRMVYDCYASRVGKGSSMGIRRLDHFMRSASANYQHEAWVLKLDIEGFFMSINQSILYMQLVEAVCGWYFKPNRNRLLELCFQVIFTDPTKNCIYRSPLSYWKGLPKNKSLFYAPYGCGLPIGNVTSQVFANLYLSGFDHFVKRELGIRRYGRYVDDFVLVHADRGYLVHCISEIEDYLAETLQLRLHPKKIRLQRVAQGVPFLGASLQVGHINAGRRIINNCRTAIKKFNTVVIQGKPTLQQRKQFRSSINSYLGMLGQWDTFTVRNMLVSEIHPYWFRYYAVDCSARKMIQRKRQLAPNSTLS